MKKQLIRKLLKALDALPDYARRKLGVGQRNEQTFNWNYAYPDDDSLIVLTDGYGGAWLQLIEGEGDNQLVNGTIYFEEETRACEVADLLMEGKLEIDDVFTGPGNGLSNEARANIAKAEEAAPND